MTETKNEFVGLLSRLLKEQGVEVEQAGKDIAVYTAERTAVLARSVGQPGFEQALVDERDNVALFAGIQLLDQAKAADARILGVIEGALAIGVRAISA